MTGTPAPTGLTIESLAGEPTGVLLKVKGPGWTGLIAMKENSVSPTPEGCPERRVQRSETRGEMHPRNGGERANPLPNTLCVSLHPRLGSRRPSRDSGDAVQRNFSLVFGRRGTGKSLGMSCYPITNSQCPFQGKG